MYEYMRFFLYLTWNNSGYEIEIKNIDFQIITHIGRMHELGNKRYCEGSVRRGCRGLTRGVSCAFRYHLFKNVEIRVHLFVFRTRIIFRRLDFLFLPAWKKVGYSENSVRLQSVLYILQISKFVRCNFVYGVTRYRYHLLFASERKSKQAS